MELTPRPRQAADFLPVDLGVRAARALSDRYGAQVLNYGSDGRRCSLTLRIPSRRELFYQSIERSRSAVAEAMSNRERIAGTMQKTEENRRRNHRLRTSLSEVRASLEAARMESRRIREGFPAGSTRGAS